MPARSPLSAHAWTDDSPADRILLFGGSGRTLDLLRLATIRSDDVTLIVEGTVEPAVRRFADAFAIAVRHHMSLDAVACAEAVLVAIGDVEAENAVVRQARLTGAPVHVAERPLVSDFNLLEFLERRASSLKRKRRPAAARPTALPNP